MYNLQLEFRVYKYRSTLFRHRHIVHRTSYIVHFDVDTKAHFLYHIVHHTSYIVHFLHIVHATPLVHNIYTCLAPVWPGNLELIHTMCHLIIPFDKLCAAAFPVIDLLG